MTTEQHYDAVVIGAGQGGSPLPAPSPAPDTRRRS